MENIFEPAINKLLSGTSNIYGPDSFQDYLRKNRLNKLRTATFISIDFYENLPKELRQNEVMVLRLGASSGTGTQFALINAKNFLDDFFLKDKELISTSSGVTYLPHASLRQLFSFQILPSLSETSLINLSLATGLLSHSLNIDSDKPLLAPATGRRNFTFSFFPHTKINELLLHNNGQIEIDALFVERREGKETLFILEAKHEQLNKSLSKHKLVYPILALLNYVPEDMPIIPVYIKTFIKDDGIHFHVFECIYPDPRKEKKTLNDLKIKEHKHFILRGFI